MRLQLDNHASLIGTGQSAAASAAQAGGASGKAGLGPATGSRDSVGLSGPSAALSRLASDRAGRVQQLSAAVKNGSYNVSSAALSSALVSHSLL